MKNVFLFIISIIGITGAKNKEKKGGLIIINKLHCRVIPCRDFKAMTRAQLYHVMLYLITAVNCSGLLSRVQQTDSCRGKMF